MKKGFSLIEVIIATTLLSVVMLALFNIKDNSTYLVNKYDNLNKNLNYILLGIDSDEVTLNDKTIYLDKQLSIKDDELRAYLKDTKIVKKEELVDTKVVKKDDFELKIIEYNVSYKLNDSLYKNIKRIKLSL